MTIGRICNNNVVYVNREVTVNAASRLMRHYHVGSLVVVDDNQGKRVPVGVVTDRDMVVEVMAMELDPRTVTVGDIMSPEVTTAPDSMSVAKAIALMRLKGIRRLPVVNDQSALTGIVALDDLVVLLADELGDLTHIVSTEREHEGRLRR